MPKHLSHAIQELKQELLALSAAVEENLTDAIKAVLRQDAELAQKVIARDDEIDAGEVSVEEECLKILALHQPVAIDLRFIVAVLKINNDLERIGDLAVNIAERALVLGSEFETGMPIDLEGMAHKVQAMLKDSLDSLVNLDDQLARQVCAADDEVDKIHSKTFIRIGEEARKDPDRFDKLIQVLSLSRYLERIADHATNIAEDVIYMTEGEIIRHQSGIW